jgi:hypothetical protein
MRLKNLVVFAIATAFVSTSMASASADAAKPGQSMTHMKTGAGLSAALEAAGVVLYVQGGATSSVIGIQSAPLAVNMFSIFQSLQTKQVYNTWEATSCFSTPPITYNFNYAILLLT